MSAAATGIRAIDRLCARSGISPSALACAYLLADSLTREPLCALVLAARARLPEDAPRSWAVDLVASRQDPLSLAWWCCQALRAACTEDPS